MWRGPVICTTDAEHAMDQGHNDLRRRGWNCAQTASDQMRGPHRPPHPVVGFLFGWGRSNQAVRFCCRFGTSLPFWVSAATAPWQQKPKTAAESPNGSRSVAGADVNTAYPGRRRVRRGRHPAAPTVRYGWQLQRPRKSRGPDSRRNPAHGQWLAALK